VTPRAGPGRLALALALALAPLAVLHPVRIIGRSMEPRLPSGSVRLALRAWCAGAPAPGQIWLVRVPGGTAAKRLLGLPGDRLEMRDGALWRNGRRQEEPYVGTGEPEPGGPWSAGRGYFLLGDNRSESRDSRAWGPVPRESLVARLLP
jgi:signal peptidase I